MATMQASDSHGNTKDVGGNSPKSIGYSFSNETFPQNDEDSDDDFFDAQEGLDKDSSDQCHKPLKVDSEYRKKIRSKNPLMFQFTHDFSGYDPAADFQYSNFQRILIKNANPKIDKRLKQFVMQQDEVPEEVAKYYGTNQGITPEQCRDYYLQRSAVAKDLYNVYVDKVLQDDEWMVDDLNDFYDKNWPQHYQENVYEPQINMYSYSIHNMPVKKLRNYLFKVIACNKLSKQNELEQNRLQQYNELQKQVKNNNKKEFLNSVPYNSVPYDKFAFVDMPEFQELKNKIRATSDQSSSSLIVEVD